MSDLINPDVIKVSTRLYGEPIEGNLVPTAKIHYEVFKQGYYHDPVIGKLHAHTLSRRALICAAAIVAILVIGIATISSSGASMWRERAIHAETQNIQLRQALIEQRSNARGLIAEVNQCSATLGAYQARMAQAEQELQAAAPTNPNAAILMGFLRFLKAVM